MIREFPDFLRPHIVVRHISLPISILNIQNYISPILNQTRTIKLSWSSKIIINSLNQSPLMNVGEGGWFLDCCAHTIESSKEYSWKKCTRLFWSHSQNAISKVTLQFGSCNKRQNKKFIFDRLELVQLGSCTGSSYAQKSHAPVQAWIHWFKYFQTITLHRFNKSCSVTRKILPFQRNS
jgi:hypothetical protein